LIVYGRFAEEETITTVECYLSCLRVEVSATSEAIFAKLNYFIEEHSLDWTKYKSVATNGAAAMQDSTKGIV